MPPPRKRAAGAGRNYAPSEECAEQGQFGESGDVGRSLVADVRTKARNAVKSGQGDRRRD
jgi:hypothetical protein